MRATFLIGPAGSGKTFRCLAEARAALKASPDGSPLLFLAPKQATFQLERELLFDPDLHGYTRLQVLSFDRLARFLLASAMPRVLSEHGRVMVLRALLLRHERDLKVFHGSVRLAGFARHLSDCLNLFQSCRISPAKLVETAERLSDNMRLADKLRDLGLIYGAYVEWLRVEQLHDTSSLLELAADSVRSAVCESEFRIEALWLDGFAELTPQELHLLLALLPGCARATLAFCADSVEEKPRDWLSPWAVAGAVAAKCCQAVRGLPDCKVALERLERDGRAGRFTGNPVLAHLEANWETLQEFYGNAGKENEGAPSPPLRIVNCTNPEAEAALAAREILRHVRGGGRFRDVGVILRSLSGHQEAIRRVFTRYEIPFFLDRREPAAHHPLAELTRAALRLAAFNWQLDDWMAALKTGLVTGDESEVDRLENAARECGWAGRAWLEPLVGKNASCDVAAMEKLRKKLVPPFDEFTKALSANDQGPSGSEFYEALQGLWRELDVMRTLETWSGEAESWQKPAALHTSVWQQMQEWLEDLPVAFGAHRLALADWIAVVEAALSGFTVGVVPPALDQVLVGTVNRSRNPNLELAIVMGMNETVFPAPPAPPLLLSEADCDALENENLHVSSAGRARLGHERYYGYIACTRARKRLVLSWSSFDAMDRKLNPSILISRIERMFPFARSESWQEARDWSDAEHAHELIPSLMARGAPEAIPVLEPVLKRIEWLRALTPSDTLTAAGANLLYGRELRTSVTSLERFGECPFKFFVHSGLRAQERKLFQIDGRKVGEFQHRLIKIFHDELVAEGKRWRDVTPEQARERIARIVSEQAQDFSHGVFAVSGRQRFAVQQLSLALQDFIEVLIAWMAQYEFDPTFIELRFGKEGEIPAWRLELSGGHALVLKGSIDRVDLLRLPNGEGLCVVMDFKSSRKKIEALFLHNGIQMQLPAYIGALRHLVDPAPTFGVRRLRPAGIFYLSLRGNYERAAHRGEALADRELARRKAYRHLGRFDRDHAQFFDSRAHSATGGHKGDQFHYALNQDGGFHRGYPDAVDAAVFTALLDSVDAQLREFGERIYAGEAAVAPYRHRQYVACDRCDYRPVCRIDPWSHCYRTLRAKPKS
ncbi:MAG: PD-(D/E)XK nuclease family protein [Verrucomicrobia subdivision 3 bacterium]|nr:PD-(D/E)XK nuclease family protein [Limisphaerales bacterium]